MARTSNKPDGSLVDAYSVAEGPKGREDATIRVVLYGPSNAHKGAIYITPEQAQKAIEVIYDAIRAGLPSPIDNTINPW